MFNFVKTKKENQKISKGFSLVELIMVVAIFLIMTAIILSKQSKFSSDILLTNVAYQVALSIREAQVNGLGNKQSGIGGTPDSFLKIPYGVNLNSNNSSRYTFFADIDDSKTYNNDQGSSNVVLPQGQTIRNFCGKPSGSSWTSSGKCSNSRDLTSLNIVFIKPNPEPIINNGAYDEAIIVVASTLGDKCRTIRVSSTGQISIDPPPALSSTDTCISSGNPL